jgi:CMP/dCMP kinase
MTSAPRVIAIDGPAGSGKSTVARAVAERLDLPYLDTGAMYRSVAFAALRLGIDPDDQDAVARLVQHVEIDVGEQVLVDGVDATIEIRGPEVTRAVSAVAANPAVRAELRRRQREWAEEHSGGVIEGRDIGTVVFPEAELKVYLTAEHDERARRRFKEVTDLRYDGSSPGLAVESAGEPGTAVEAASTTESASTGEIAGATGSARAAEPAAVGAAPSSTGPSPSERSLATVEGVAADLARRDHADTTRATAPLAIAEGAVVIDTTGRTIEAIVDDVLERL